MVIIIKKAMTTNIEISKILNSQKKNRKIKSDFDAALLSLGISVKHKKKRKK